MQQIKKFVFDIIEIYRTQNGFMNFRLHFIIYSRSYMSEFNLGCYWCYGSGGLGVIGCVNGGSGYGLWCRWSI
jgi:hypothetical protein